MLESLQYKCTDTITISMQVCNNCGQAVHNSHPCASVTKQYTSVPSVLCNTLQLRGNCRSGAVLANGHALQTSVILQAQCLRKGHEHSTYASV